MSGDTSDLNTETLGRGLGEFARNVTEGYNGQTPPPPGGETETGNGDAPPPPPTPATNTPPAQEQGQNWLMNLLAQKFGFSSGQEMMSGILDMIFGKLDLSGIPIIGDFLSRGSDTRTAENVTPTTPTNETPVVTADNTTPTGALDTASERVRTDYDAAAGAGATDVAAVDPALVPGPGNGQG